MDDFDIFGQVLRGFVFLMLGYFHAFSEVGDYINTQLVEMRPQPLIKIASIVLNGTVEFVSARAFQRFLSRLLRPFLSKVTTTSNQSLKLNILCSLKQIKINNQFCKT